MIKRYFLLSMLTLVASAANASDAAEILTEAAPVIVQTTGEAVKQGAAIVAEVAKPIINQVDMDTIGENLHQIGTNLYQIGENTLRILVGATVKITTGAAKGTKFMADHPVFGACCIAATGYAWYKWNEADRAYQTTNNGRRLTLVEMVRTTAERWRQA